MNADYIDLIHDRYAQKIANLQGNTIHADEFLRHVDLLVKQLPTHKFAINLCTDRYYFCVAFAAVLARQQTNLLPSNHTLATIQEVGAEFSDCYCLTDHTIEQLSLPQYHIQAYLKPKNGLKPAALSPLPKIAAEHTACIVFTSGSTGKPSANHKKWIDLVSVAEATQKWLNIRKNSNLTIVATVPPQHMYGLETSIMLPLISGIRFDSSKPFFPEDIRATLAAIPGPVGLVTTPVHLRACVESNIDWPKTQFVLSATAPLSENLAASAEHHFHSQILEIYGCTESGSIAHRRTANGECWTLYEDMTLHQHGEDFYINSYHLADPIRLNDNLEIHDPRHFSLLGRKSDLIIIAGKRSSLADLNSKLLSIDGVTDGIIFCPESDPNQNSLTTRLVAFVVAPHLDVSSILASLRKQIDAAFLPRPIYKVDELPRESSSKLPIKVLHNMLAELRVKS